jgi:hypothetical protein
VASTKLAELAPDVAELFSNFHIDNFAQESMLAALESTDVSVMQTTCTWIRSEQNVGIVRSWLQLLSCEDSEVRVDGTVFEGDAVTVLPSGSMRVHLDAYETGNVPMKRTRADVEFRFGGHVLPVEWSQGSNQYTARVSADLTQNDGEYELSVDAYGWSNALKQTTSCNLFRRMVQVKGQSGISTTWLLVGAATTGVVFVGILVVVVRKRHAHLRAIFLLLFTETSELVLALFAELADLATDIISCRRVLNGDIQVPSEAYKAGYVTILCFGVTGSIISLACRFRNARQVQAHVQQLSVTSSPGRFRGSEVGQQAQRFEWELRQTQRTLVVLGLALMTVLLQGPYGLFCISPLPREPSHLQPFPPTCCRFAHVQSELRFDFRERQHRQNGAE